MLFKHMKYLRAPINLKDKKVLIMGLGTKDGGVGAALWAAKQGARVTITDLNDKHYLTKSLAALNGISARYVLGLHDEKDFINNDIIIKNPGINRSNKFLQIAETYGKIIDSAEGIFSEIVSRPYIGVTGTKGKSFTTHLTEHLLNSLNIKAVAAGNNCVSPLRFVNEEQPHFVLELSSWQLKEMAIHKKSPHVACWLNFFPDHLNYYQDMQDYWIDKHNITKFQQENDFAILPLSDKKLRNCSTKARKVFFSLHADTNKLSNVCYVLHKRIVMRKDDQLVDIVACSELPPVYQAPHHLELLLAAVCCVNSFVDSSICFSNVRALKNAIHTFRGLPHRFEHIPNRIGITIINDSAATTPDSVIRALESIVQKPLVLLYGGGGMKNLSVSALAKKVIEHVTLLILFNNDEPSDELYEVLTDEKAIKEKVNINIVGNMEDAVHKGIDFLFGYGQGTLLFSPGCKGYPVYQDLFVRGNMFKQCVEKFQRSQ